MRALVMCPSACVFLGMGIEAHKVRISPYNLIVKTLARDSPSEKRILDKNISAQHKTLLRALIELRKYNIYSNFSLLNPFVSETSPLDEQNRLASVRVKLLDVSQSKIKKLGKDRRQVNLDHLPRQYYT